MSYDNSTLIYWGEIITYNHWFSDCDNIISRHLHEQKNLFGRSYHRIVQGVYCYSWHGGSGFQAAKSKWNRCSQLGLACDRRRCGSLQTCRCPGGPISFSLWRVDVATNQGPLSVSLSFLRCWFSDNLLIKLSIYFKYLKYCRFTYI